MKKRIDVEVELTADGSTTLYRKDIDEHYHSVKGALIESRHIYIKEGYEFMLSKSRRDAHSCDFPYPQSVRVLEIGFGTGLNAALTVEAARECQVATNYFSLELYPLNRETIEQLGYEQHVKNIREVNDAEWNQSKSIGEFFSLNKMHCDFMEAELPENIDVVYFDAFAPEKQPEMWAEDNFRRIYEAMRPGGVLTTYCAKGAIRRMLEKIGFQVERIPGPPGGKREILRAIKKGD